MRGTLFLAGLLVPTLVTAQSNSSVQPARRDTAVVVTPGATTWGPAPAILPPGAKLAVLEGDPTKPGPFTMRLAMPEGYRLPPHFHPANEHVTVISGEFQVGMGDTFQESKLTTLPAGTFGLIPAGMRHFARAKGASVLQLHGSGPWKLTYVNPADQPKTTSSR